MKNGKMKLSGESIFWEYAKKLQVNSRTRSRSRPRIQRALSSQDLQQMQHFLLPRSHSLFYSIILHILHKLFDKVDGFCIMQFSQSNSKVFWVVYLKGFMSSSLKLHDSNSTTYFSNFISSILWIIIIFFTSKFFFSCNRWCLAQLWDTSLFF